MESFTRPFIQLRSKSILFFLFILQFATSQMAAQVVVTENFNSYNNALPMGWTWTGVNGSSENTNRWLDHNNQVGAWPIPNAAAFSSPNYIYYNSIGALTGDQAVLVTKSFDLSARGGSPAGMSIRMYRDNLSTNSDSITIYAGSSPALASATRLGVLRRYYTYAPAATANTWNQYTFALPPAFNTAHTYIFFLGTSRVGNDILLDDFTIDTWPSNMAFNSTTMWQQGTQVITAGSTNEVVSGICIIADNAANPLNLYRITFNCNGSSNPLADIQNAKLWYTGQSGTFNVLAPLTNQLGSTFMPVTSGSKIAFMNPGATPLPLVTLTNDTNYFWLTYDIKSTAVAGDLMDAEFDSIAVGATFAGAGYYAPAVFSMSGAIQVNQYCTPTFVAACNSCYVQGTYLAGANNSKISTGSSSMAAPVNTGSMVNGTLYCINTCIVSLNTPYRYKIYPPIQNQTATMNCGLTYTLKLQVGTWTGSNGLAAWIDYNNDFDFDDTLIFGGISYYEKIGQYGSNSILTPGCTGGLCSVTGSNWGSGVINFNFKVPPMGTPGLFLGNCRMRIREGFGQNNLSPCSSFSFGEAEDYTVTISPGCVSGLCQWLGYTDDWNTPSNWCPGVPTLSDVARVDFNYSYTPANGYHMPVIRSGVNAACKVLRISNVDTVFISSPKYDETTGNGLVSAATLTIADSMRINYNTASGNGALKVNSIKSDSAQISNGTYGLIPFSPFLTNKRNIRMQLIITRAELNAKGMIEGDAIDSLVFYIRALSAAAADQFDNFTIKVANLTVPGWSFPAVPVGWAPSGAFSTVFGPTTLDIRNVQAGHPNAVPSVTAANKGQLSLVTIPNSFVWNGVDDIVIDICFRNIFNSLQATNVLVSQTQTTGVRKMCMATNSSNNLTSPLCGINFPLPTGVGNLAVATDYRPNVTLKFSRPFSKALITMAGDAGAAGGYWVNNGNFTAGLSKVLFTGNLTTQQIMGSNITSFSDLAIDQHSNEVIMQKDVMVDSTLEMMTGQLTLNRSMLSINRSSPAAVTRTSGWIKSENPPPGNYSRMSWNIGITPGLYVFPFGLNATGYIPFHFTPTGDAGTVTVATYETAIDNKPYPTATAPFGIGVMHMQGQATGADISITDVVDRFWQISKSGPSTNASIRFSYMPAASPTGEEPFPGGFTYTAQRFQIPGGTGSLAGGWANLGGANASGYLNVTLSNDPINGPWTLGNQANPLPISLLYFNAMLTGDIVKTWWETASESDNDYFVVERTTGNDVYDFISNVKSKGNSMTAQQYEAWDNFPVKGLQYYRLKTIGKNGDESLSGEVPVTYGNSPGFDINFVYTDFEKDHTLISLQYNSSLPFSLRIMDVYGRTIYYSESNYGVVGENRINLENILQTHGIYFVTVENTEDRVVKSFVY